MLKIKMLSRNIPIAAEDGTTFLPKEGDVIEVSNSVGTALIRGGDGEQVVEKEVVATVVEDEIKLEIKPKKFRKKTLTLKKKNRGNAPENK